MPARVFSNMSRVFKRTFGEPGVHYWQRHDAAEPDVIELVFNEFPEEIDADGFGVEDPKPIAYVSTADALALAPGRASRTRAELFDNRDTLIIVGRSYRVESCRPDGFAMCEITLKKVG